MGHADIILYNGRFFTCDPGMPSAEAVAVASGRFIAVGPATEIERHSGPNTRRVDLQQHVVVPGFNDAHCHFMPSPELIELEFKSMEPVWDEVRTMIEAMVRQTPTGKWISGTIGADVILNDTVTRFELDRLTQDHPVWLHAWTGHGYIMNSKALKLLQIAEDEPDPWVVSSSAFLAQRRLTAGSPSTLNGSRTTFWPTRSRMKTSYRISVKWPTAPCATALPLCKFFRQCLLNGLSGCLTPLACLLGCAPSHFPRPAPADAISQRSASLKIARIHPRW